MKKSLQSPVAPENPNANALAALDRWLTSRGTYNVQARADVRREIRLTGDCRPSSSTSRTWLTPKPSGVPRRGSQRNLRHRPPLG